MEKGIGFEVGEGLGVGKRGGLVLGKEGLKVGKRGKGSRRVKGGEKGDGLGLGKGEGLRVGKGGGLRVGKGRRVEAGEKG